MARRCAGLLRDSEGCSTGKPLASIGIVKGAVGNPVVVPAPYFHRKARNKGRSK
jgi:hypothetical protein